MLRIKIFSLILVAGLTVTACSNSVSTPYCVTYMDSGVSSTISNNFNCIQASVSGSNLIVKSSNLPNYKSYYYGSSSELYEALPSGNTPAGTNLISSQNMKYTIPITGTLQTSGTLSGTQAGLISIGVTTNGIAIFNNSANAPDQLTTEASTFDNYTGHPQNSGIYHYHTEPAKLSNNDSALIGIALDGFLVYGRKCDNGTASTADDFTPSTNTNASSFTGSVSALTGGTTNTLDEVHGHVAVTQHLSTATYHYHTVTAEVVSGSTGLKTIMGSYFRGIRGSVSN